MCVCVCVCVCLGGRRGGATGRERGKRQVRENVFGCVCVHVCGCRGGEGQSEICNALLNQVVYCCNVSCIAL